MLVILSIVVAEDCAVARWYNLVRAFCLLVCFMC